MWGVFEDLLKLLGVIILIALPGLGLLFFLKFLTQFAKAVGVDIN